MPKTFKYAGVSRNKGKMSFRATNRANPVYPNILKKDGHEDIDIVELTRPMTKEEARKNLTTRKAFQTPEILACLRQADKEEKDSAKAKSNVSKPAKAKKPAAAKKPSKKKDKEQAEAAGIEDTVLVTPDEDEVDVETELGSPSFLKHTGGDDN